MTKYRIAVACLCLLSTSAWGAQRQGSTPGREAFYRCRDAQGQLRYSDGMPPECVGRDTEVLNERGTVMRIIEGRETLAAKASERAQEEERQREKEARAQRDRVLIDTYLTVADIERLRDQRLDLLEAQLRVTEQNLAGLKEREARLKQQIARFRPYSDKPDAPPLPDHLAEDLVSTVNSMKVYAQSITDKRQEQSELKARFASDIQRFKELKGLK